MNTKIAALKLLIKFLLFVFYVFILWFVILARNQFLWVVFGSVTVLAIFIYFVIYRTQVFARNLR